MVECECLKKLFFHLKRWVLIDTWWNVNFIKHCSTKRVYFVLIDTWWNVNMINNDAWISEEIVLIDTWWNVN